MRKRPRDPRPYAALGALYEILDRDEDSDRALQTAADLGSSNFQVYYQLAKHHQIEHPGRADKNCLTANALASSNEAARKIYETLSKMYIIEGRYKEADAIFKKILALEPDYLQRPLTLAMSTGASATAANYRTLLELVRARGITLIAMQYAREDISDLRRLLGKQDGVLFLSNKEIFEKALKKVPYEDLFLDRFGKTWGHCTRKGNRLIAANAAKAVDAWLAATKKRGLRSSWAPAENHNLIEQKSKVAKDLTQ